jgi:hypothetical protein
MSLAVIYSRAKVGIHAPLVHVETHLSNGLPSFSIVGLPETTVKESKDRVRSAILTSGFEFPASRITVNLAPADLPKDGGRFDLAIALGILLASGQLPNEGIDRFEAVARGSGAPFEPNTTEEGRIANRRVELYVRGLLTKKEVEDLQDEVDRLDEL